MEDKKSQKAAAGKVEIQERQSIVPVLGQRTADGVSSSLSPGPRAGEVSVAA